MAETGKYGKWADLQEMKRIIGQLDELLGELKELGGEMPVIEKNVKAMKSFVAVLQYGISDLVEVSRQEE